MTGSSEAIAPAGGGASGQLPRWRRALAQWWAEFSLQTKLLAVATLVVSLLMTGITFFALNGIQQDARMSDTRYARDLGLLLSANVTPLVAEGNDRELAAVAERCAVPLLILDLQVPRPLLERRIGQRQRAGGDPSDADLAVLARQLACQEPLTAAEQALSITIGAEPELDAILGAIRASSVPLAFNGSCQQDD